MQIHGNVYQITSDGYNSAAYLNLRSNPGYICAWGNHYASPTIFVQDGYTFYVYQFDNEEYFQEWLEENKDEHYMITRLIGKSE